jgi:hypothetical protein
VINASSYIVVHPREFSKTIASCILECVVLLLRFHPISAHREGGIAVRGVAGSKLMPTLGVIAGEALGDYVEKR